MTEVSGRVVVFGNEKGGTGKSTLAMHVLVSLLQANRSVVVIDLDVRQRSLTRYIENRQRFVEQRKFDLLLPKVSRLEPSDRNQLDQREIEDTRNLQAMVDQLRIFNDIVVIDCPGNHTPLAVAAHVMADILVTPVNDSFLDLDVIGEIHPETFELERFSHYTEMVWEARKRRSAALQKPTDWVVARNRMSIQQAKNKKRVHFALSHLQKRCDFRYLPGLSERVIFRELFPVGLTLLDYQQVPLLGKLSMSHVAARQELRMLTQDLGLIEEGADG